MVDGVEREDFSETLLASAGGQERGRGQLGLIVPNVASVAGMFVANGGEQ